MDSVLHTLASADCMDGDLTEHNWGQVSYDHRSYAFLERIIYDIWKGSYMKHFIHHFTIGVKTSIWQMLSPMFPLGKPVHKNNKK